MAYLDFPVHADCPTPEKCHSLAGCRGDCTQYSQRPAADWPQVLTNSYAKALADEESRLEFLADYIFDFTTYDSEMSELFAKKALEVCAAINDQTTFDYINDADDYRWYLLLCNMPFFADRLEWGTSIRGAWWDNGEIAFDTCGLWSGDEQMTETLRFDRAGWEAFTRALIEFAA